jgi:hypothetical protein
MKHILSTEFRRDLKYQVLLKSNQWELSFFNEDGRTDMTKLVVAFRNFANGPESL